MKPKGVRDVSIPDSGLRRVTVHTGTAHADLALPAGVPVSALIASVVELVPHPDGPSLRPYRLCEPGRAAIDGTKTLAQHGIRDGAILVLTRDECPAPRVRFDDPAEQAAAAVRVMARPWNPSARRLTTALAASGLAGVAGFAAVPGGPGAPNALLAVAAAGAVVLMSVPSSGCSGPVRTTLCCLAGLAVVAAVAGIGVAVTGLSRSGVGAVAAATGVGLVRAAGRIAGLATGLSHRPQLPAEQVSSTHDLFTGMVSAAAALVVLGAAGAVSGPGAPHGVGVVFAAAAGAALVLRARSHTDGAQIAVLVAGGTAATGIALLSAAISAARVWPAAVAAALAATTIGLGFAAPLHSALIRRGAEVVEGLALGSLAPLAFWLCGFYGAARGLSLG